MTQSEIYCIFHLPLFRSSQAREQPPPRLRSCQRKKAQCILPSWYTVYTNEPCYTVYMFSYTTCVEACIRVRCISFGFGVCPLYWEDQVFEYKYVVNLHWGWIWEISAFSFLFWNFYLNNASSVGQTRCNCSDHLFIRGVFQHNQCFNQWSPLAPAKYIFYRATKRRLYLIRKSGGKNQDYDIFWEAIYCIINRLPLDETGKHGPFPELIWRRTC